jgi:CP family cyanate transporter-like MFS transporter
MGNASVLSALLLVALNLRPAMASLGPVLEQVRASLQLSYGVAGLLSSVPIICMGVFASLAMPLSARFGMRNSILGATLLIGGATLLRVQVSLFSQLCSMLLTGASIAVLGPLLSAYIKQQFPKRSARISSWVTTALCLGAAFAAGSSALLSDYLGWPCALSSWALLAFAAAWFWQRTIPVTPTATPRASRLPWRSVRAWQLLLTFGLNSLVFYSLLAWLAPAFISVGVSAARAGQLLGVFAIVQIIGTALISALPSQQRERRPALLLCGVITAAGLFGMWQAPLAAAYLWMSLLGAGSAGLFALSLILPLDYSDSPTAAGDWMAMMSSGGYLIAAGGPYLCGVLRDATGSYVDVFASLLLVSCTALLLGLLLGPAPSKNSEAKHAL